MMKTKYLQPLVVVDVIRVVYIVIAVVEVVLRMVEVVMRKILFTQVPSLRKEMVQMEEDMKVYRISMGWRLLWWSWSDFV